MDASARAGQALSSIRQRGHAGAVHTAGQTGHDVDQAVPPSRVARGLAKSTAITEGRKPMSERVILTTSSHLEGYRVTEHIDVVSSECVFGMNILKDMFAGFRDFFGGRNKSSQAALRDARITCLDELRREAGEIGANAVIGIDLDYSEISGGGKSMLFLVATGTAVKVAK
ncbi:MAG: YbjQ family protein, partial [Halomonas sp.]|nr:YbjQ family protein [Halomonas sp.]MDX5504019.1 YbjQ family protein [Halomonas sp.]